MDKSFLNSNPSAVNTFNSLQDLYKELNDKYLSDLKRSLPFNEMVIDRWERAKELGFGEKSSIYDSSLVIGKVSVGKNVWIGPFTIIDGSGDLSIGDNCTVAAGVHIYTHDNIKATLSGGKTPIERASVEIGSCTYIGPNALITKGIKIGNFCIVAAGALVKDDFPDYSIIAGTPAKRIGSVKIEGEDIKYVYDK